MSVSRIPAASSAATTAASSGNTGKVAGSLDEVDPAPALATGEAGGVAATEASGDWVGVAVMGVHAAQTKHAASTNLRISTHTTTRDKWFLARLPRRRLDLLRHAA